MIIRFGIALSISFDLSLSASAQRYIGSIQGDVTDSSSTKVVGATVVAEGATHFKS